MSFHGSFAYPAGYQAYRIWHCSNAERSPRGVSCHMRVRFNAVVARANSVATLCSPRIRNRLIPRCSFKIPMTGSASAFRRRYRPGPSRSCRAYAVGRMALVAMARSKLLQVQLFHGAVDKETKMVFSQHVPHARRQQIRLLGVVLEKIRHRAASSAQYTDAVNLSCHTDSWVPPSVHYAHHAHITRRSNAWVGHRSGA